MFLSQKKHFLVMLVLLLSVGMMLSGCGEEAVEEVVDEPEEVVDDPEEPVDEPEEEVDFPTGTIYFVNGNDPGGPLDTYARLYVPFLEEELGVDVQIVNQEGANQMNAFSYVARSEPDGHAILITIADTMAHHTVEGTMEVIDDWRDFEWFAVPFHEPPVIASAVDNIQDWEDLLSRDNIVFGDRGYASGNNPMMAYMFDAFDVDFTFVPGYTLGEIFTATIAHELDVFPRTTPLIEEPGLLGTDLHAVLTLDVEPDPLAPDAETLADLAERYDMPELTDPVLISGFMNTFILGTTQGTPSEHIDILVEAFRNVHANPDFQAVAEENYQRYGDIIGVEETEVVVDRKTEFLTETIDAEYLFDLIEGS